MIYSHVPPTRVKLRPTAQGQDARTLADWPCGWTHFIVNPDFSDRATVREALYAYRLALLACEQVTPQAIDHIAHIRRMVEIYADSVAWNASTKLHGYRGPLATPGFVTPIVDQTGLALHGPDEEPLDSAEDRARALRALAGRMLDRVELRRMRACDIEPTFIAREVYHVPDDLYVLLHGIDSKGRAVIDHPMCGARLVPITDIREV